jgi:hypothetical protein
MIAPANQLAVAGFGPADPYWCSILAMCQSNTKTTTDETLAQTTARDSTATVMVGNVEAGWEVFPDDIWG